MTHGQASIQAVLGGLLKNRQLVPGLRRVMVLSMWEQVVGELVAQKSWPETITDGVLTVGVISSAWAHELNLIKPQLLARYRDLLGRSVLKDIKFRVARRKSHAQEDETMVMPLHPTPQEVLPATPVPGRVLDGVTNPEVRDLLGPVFARMRAARDWKREKGWARCGDCHRIFHGPVCPDCGGHPDVGEGECC